MELLEIELFKQTCPPCYGEYYDDVGIDEIVWSEIRTSASKADFFCYLLHNLQNAKHEDEARSRIKAMSGVASGNPVGYIRSIEHIRNLAMEGDPASMFHMGKFYAHGIGVRRDLQLAKSWYCEAIDAGEMRAHCDMGWLYLHGVGGIPQNKVEAFRLLSIGAQKGIHAARASIGMMLLTGDGLPANPEFGLSMLHNAFDYGYNNAGNLLSELHFSGVHLARNIELAHDWLDKVAARGDTRTMAILGHYLVTGSHGKQDVVRGLALLHDSVERDNIFAYQWLGNLYRDGIGVSRDIGKAMEWYSKGAAAGNERCGQSLLKLMHETASSSAQSGCFN